MDVPNATAIDSSKTALLSENPRNCAKPVAISAPAPRHVRSRAQPKSTRCCGDVVSQCPVDQSPRLPLSRLRPVCAQLEQSVWSCPSWLRIIPSTPKSGNMPSYYTIMRGRCRDSAPRLLPAGGCGTSVVMPQASLHLVTPRCCVTSAPGRPGPPQFKRKRSTEPKAFEGLTQKPPLCRL